MLGLDAIGDALGLSAGRAGQALAAVLRRVIVEPRRVIAVGDELGRALSRAGLDVVVVTPTPRKRRRKKDPLEVRGRPDALPLAAASVDAVFASGVVVAGAGLLGELARVVRSGGIIAVATPGSALVRKVTPPEVIAASFVHAALVDVEQQPLGSLVLTWGRVAAVRPTLAAPVVAALAGAG